MRKFYGHFATLFLLFLTQTLNSQSQKVELIITGDTLVGEPLTIEVVAFYLGGIDQVSMLIDGDLEYGQIIKDCGGAVSCTLFTTITQDYVGSKTVWGDMKKNGGAGYLRTSTILDFKCNQEYCPPDPLMDDFFQWMRQMNYPECITSKYIQYSSDSEFRNGGRFLPSMKWFISKRHIFEDTIINIDFVDVIPTDSEATFKGLSENEAEFCTPDATWPGVCPNPISADYKYLEAYLKETFGVNVVLNYIRKEIDYSEVIGEPSLVSGRHQFPFGGRRSYIGQFPTNSIIHWAIESWNGGAISDMTGGGNVAEIDYELSSTYGLVVTTHEWGHSLGLRNGSSVLPHPFQDRNGQRAYFQIDGIMSNTYRSGTGAQDPLDPLERYAFEPPMGFLDSSTFVQKYFDGIIGWPSGLNVCDSVDVAIKSLEIINQTSDSITVQFTIENENSRNTGFVNVGLVNDEHEIEEMRTIEFVNWGSPILMNWTIKDCSGDYRIVVDPLEKIVEKNENNNVVRFTCTPTSTTSIDKDYQFHIYPNPTSELINIKSMQIGQKGSVSIYNIDGILLSEFYFDEVAMVNVSNYPTGLYLIQIKTEDHIAMRKFVKE